MTRFLSRQNEGSPPPEEPGGRASDRILTVPNLLCGVRLAGSVVLIGLALLQRPYWFLAGYLFLSFTDWLDGKLAVLLDQRTVFGARLDSAADATLYAALLFGGAWLLGDVVGAEFLWISLAVGSYLISTAAGLWKFGRVPSYHTRAAKASWLLILAGVVCIFAEWTVWPFRVAMLAVTATNIEAVLITCVLTEWRADVPSLFHARREHGLGPQHRSP